MKRWTASALILLLVVLNVSTFKQIKNVDSAPSDPSLNYAIRLKVYFNGSILVESTGELVSPNPNMTSISASANFTKSGDSVVVHHRATMLLPSDFSFVGVSGSGTYANGSASMEMTIQQPFPDFEDTSARIDLNRTVIAATANTTAVYGGLLGLNNETLKVMIDVLKLGGLNQSYVNSTIYGYAGGKVECTDLTINVVNGTSSAFISFSARFEGDVFLGLVYMVANLTGQPYPSPGQEATISSMIDDALDMVISSSFTISSNSEGELVFIGITYLVGTFDNDLTDLKNQVLLDFLSGLPGFDFLHLTDLQASNMSVAFSSDSTGSSWRLKWLFVNPPVEILNATDFDIPELFVALGGMNLPSENLTFTIDGESNLTRRVIVVVPGGVPLPDTNASATWHNVPFASLEGVWFRIAPALPPPFFIFSYDTMLWFTALSGVTSFVVVLSVMYRRRFAVKQIEAAKPNIVQTDEQNKE